MARGDDAMALHAIYAPIVRDTVISFEVEPPTIEEMRDRVTETMARWPWLVCEIEGQVQGFAYASRHRARPAYQWSVDVTVYVHPQRRRSGMGRALYVSLLALLERQGFSSAFAGIALPNPGSVGLHEALGFRPVGVYRRVGFKHGAWHDVGWWQLELGASAAPPPPVAITELPELVIETALAAGMPHLRLESR